MEKEKESGMEKEKESGKEKKDKKRKKKVTEITSTNEKKIKKN